MDVDPGHMAAPQRLLRVLLRFMVLLLQPLIYCVRSFIAGLEVLVGCLMIPLHNFNIFVVLKEAVIAIMRICSRIKQILLRQGLTTTVLLDLNMLIIFLALLYICAATPTHVQAEEIMGQRKMTIESILAMLDLRATIALVGSLVASVLLAFDHAQARRHLPAMQQQRSRPVLAGFLLVCCFAIDFDLKTFVLVNGLTKQVLSSVIYHIIRVFWTGYYLEWRHGLLAAL